MRSPMGGDLVGDFAGDLDGKNARTVLGLDGKPEVKPQAVGERLEKFGLGRAFDDGEHLGRMADGRETDREMNQQAEGITADRRGGEKRFEFLEVMRVIGAGHGWEKSTEGA